MEVQERIKKVEAAFTWPHATDKGWFSSAIFVRTEKDEPYLLYCPRASASVTIDEETYNTWFICGDPTKFRDLTLTQKLRTGNDVQFYVIYLGIPEKIQISKKEIEKMFGIKVVD